ncbi:MAG: acetyl-CoA carboxylase biotin carboxyl carrier protein [Pirellulales bacterium]|nr:acetyl-CoA carboxylase biotin carboxyl carrier protein [Pirellulales bacterium]
MRETPSVDVFDLKKIRRLVELMKEHDLNEMDLEQGEQRIRLRRGITGQVMTNSMPAPVAAPAGGGKPTVEDTNIVTINSPMVGTFYTSPSPEAGAYVKVGDHVGDDSTVCIVEAMKVFNEIPAETSGKIVAILVENGEPVEYGQPLFKVDTSA